MNSLKQALALKAVPIRCVEKDCNPVAMVRLCPWQDKEWALPWSRLDAFSSFREVELERVELFFPHHHIVLVGENLRGIAGDILRFQVSCLRELPAAHRANLERCEAFILRLEVRLLADLRIPPSLKM